jgi:chromosome segregation ATPase
MPLARIIAGRAPLSPSMSTDLPLKLDGWDAVSESIDQFRAAREESGCFFAEWFGQVESLLTGLVREEARSSGQREQVRREWEQTSALRNEQERRLASAQAELDAMRGERDAAKVERQLVEAELENVRHRVEQLAEMLEDQKRTAAAQESYWRGEFRRQCSIVERLTTQWTQPAPSTRVEEIAHPSQSPAAATAASAPPNVTPDKTSGEGEALESVRAQFELLQNDAARRRRESGPTP